VVSVFKIHASSTRAAVAPTPARRAVAAATSAKVAPRLATAAASRPAPKKPAKQTVEGDEWETF